MATTSPTCLADPATRSKRVIEPAYTPALPRHKEHAKSAGARCTKAALERHELLAAATSRAPTGRAPTGGAARPPRDALPFPS